MKMKMSRLMDSSVGDFESRKRALQRREMGQIYRKNAQYQSSKNPLLKALENLLSGNTEKELHAADLAEKEQSRSELNGLQDRKASTGEEMEDSAENPAVPALMMNGREVQGETPLQEDGTFLKEEAAHSAEVDDHGEIPARFIGSFAERDVAQGTLLPGRQIESRAYERLFQMASMSYSNHVAMVKNDYRSFDEPTFSKTA
ncbi:MAG: hypothetical protein ACI33P_01925 [Lysinibacillus sp.]